MTSYSVVFSLIGVVAVTAPGLADAQGNRPRSLDTRVFVLPTPVATAAGSILGYELHITNTGSRDHVLVGIDIVRDSGPGGQSHFLRGDSLLRALDPVGRRDTTISAATLRSGRQVVVFLWEPAGVGTGRSVTLAHRLLVVPADSVSAVPDTVGPVRVPVPLRPAAVIAAPLEGGPWFARNGPGNGADHRRTLLVIRGVERIAQRFATDWIKLGPDYRMWHGDSTVNRNWYGYGVPVRAASPGVIVAAYDGVPENTPLASEHAIPITLETVAGNYIIEDLGSGRYALYAHLQPGSLRALVGQRVRVGQVLGSLGNSGNSGAPHLHFHLMDAGGSPLGGEGLPFVFREYIVEGTVADLEDLFRSTPWKPVAVSARRRELPTENMVVRFPVLRPPQAAIRHVTVIDVERGWPPASRRRPKRLKKAPLGTPTGSAASYRDSAPRASACWPVPISRTFLPPPASACTKSCVPSAMPGFPTWRPSKPPPSAPPASCMPRTPWAP